MYPKWLSKRFRGNGNTGGADRSAGLRPQTRVAPSIGALSDSISFIAGLEHMFATTSDEPIPDCGRKMHSATRNLRETNIGSIRPRL
jgi:hypothetical protein